MTGMIEMFLKDSTERNTDCAALVPFGDRPWRKLDRLYADAPEIEGVAKNDGREEIFRPQEMAKSRANPVSRGIGIVVCYRSQPLSQ